MRSRTVLIGCLVLGLLALCACAVLGGALLGYQVLYARGSPTLPSETPTVLVPPPSLTRPGPTPSSSMEVPGLPLRMAVPVEGVITIASSPNGERLTLLTVNGQTGYLDLQSGEITEGMTAPEPVEELVFSPDGQVFALRSRSQILLFDPQLGQTRFTLPIQETVHRIAFSPQGTLLLVGGERTLRGYYVETGRQAFAFALSTPADAFVMTPDEQLIFQMSAQTSDLQVWNAQTGRQWGSIQLAPLTAIALSPDGQRLAAAENEMRMTEMGYEAPFPTRLALWALHRGQDRVMLDLAQMLDFNIEFELQEFPVPLSVRSLAFTSDGRRIVGLADWVGEGDTNGRLYVWDTTSGRMIGRAVLPPRPLQMFLTEQGRSVAILIGYYTGWEVRIYEIPER
jgi:WD40 repeat protein